MATNRIPLKPARRGPDVTITPRAVKLFRLLEKLECVCEPVDWRGEYWRRDECASCRQCKELEDQILNELNLKGGKPWEMICLEHPDSVSPYPEWHPSHATWGPCRAGQEIYRALQDASKEAARTKRRRHEVTV